MARQKTKLSDRFGSGGNKDNSPEEKFFSDTDIQIDPEWKVIELLRSQIDDITDVVNANDAGSGSFAASIKEITSAVATNTSKTGISTSQASAITANSAKTGITPTQASRITANTAKTTISDAQASAITANTAKVGTETDLSVTEGITIKATVANSRGNYTLTFTMTHGETTKSATIKLL